MSSLKKRVQLYTICWMLLFLMVGCTDSTEDNNTQSPPEITGDSLILSENKTVTTTLSSGVKVDATVMVDSSVDLQSLTESNVRLVVKDFELLKKVLLHNKSIVQETAEETAESRVGSLFHYCRTEDGFSLASSGENIYFNSPMSDKVNAILSNSMSNDDNLFRTSKNLDFASLDLAQTNIENTLEQLDLSVVKSPIVFTMDYETLLLESQSYNREMEGKMDGMIPSITIEKSDECYVLVYQLATDNRPISTHMNGVFGDGSWTSGTFITCTYSKDGLVGLFMNYQFVPMKENTSKEVGLSVSEILARLDNKYNSMILEGEYLVDSIEFEYVPMPHSGATDKYTLVPAWRISILHTYEVNQKDDKTKKQTINQRYTVSYDAIHGNELLIDSGNA